MAAARYWRVIGVETYGGGDLELSELQLFSDTERVDGAATLTCSHAPVSGALADLKDGSTATTCRFAGVDVRSAGFWLQWDFGPTATDVAYLLPASALEEGQFLAACRLQWSNDRLSWSDARAAGRYPWPGASLFAPVSESGTAVALVAWYDASDSSSLILSGGEILGWNDISGAGRHFTLSQSGRRPTLNITFFSKPCVDFSGGKFLETASMYTGGPEWTVWMVVRRTAAAKDYHSLGLYAAASAFYESAFFAGVFGSPPNPGSMRLNNSTETTVSVPDVVSTAGAACFSSKGDATPVNFYWQSVLRGRTYNEVLNTDLKFSRVGGDSDGLYLAGGAIAEIAVFSRKLSDAEVCDLQVYAEQKWGVPISGALPSGNMPLDEPSLPVFAGNFLRTSRTPAQLAASAPVPAFSTRRAAPLQLARDVEHGGPGTIYGTTKTKGTPNTSTRARVVLLHQRSKLPVRETWSDPVTGAFVFSGIDTSQQFLALAEDAEGHFRPVAANRLTPEVLA